MWLVKLFGLLRLNVLILTLFGLYPRLLLYGNHPKNDVVFILVCVAFLWSLPNLRNELYMFPGAGLEKRQMHSVQAKCVHPSMELCDRLNRCLLLLDQRRG